MKTWLIPFLVSLLCIVTGVVYAEDDIEVGGALLTYKNGSEARVGPG